jgi:threonine/homoserine/homoserine lactone efflux protein
LINLTLLGFVFLGLFSPGPNVILLTASGGRFGFRASIPHILGVALGVGVIAGVTGLGVGAALAAQPTLALILKAIASLWILWMAWGLWHAKPLRKGRADKPFTFVQAVLFQWVNPKIWAVALSATAYVASLPPMTQAAQLAVTFSGTNFGVCIFWTLAGTLLGKLLSAPFAWVVFMRVMAVALVVFSGMVFL